MFMILTRSKIDVGRFNSWVEFWFDSSSTHFLFIFIWFPFHFSLPDVACYSWTCTGCASVRNGSECLKHKKDLIFVSVLLLIWISIFIVDFNMNAKLMYSNLSFFILLYPIQDPYSGKKYELSDIISIHEERSTT